MSADSSKRKNTPAAPIDLSDDRGIRISIGDLLNIKVYHAPDLTLAIRVDAAGQISLPLAGRLTVAGLTPSEVELLLEQRLLEREVLNNPHVNVTVQEYATQGISIFGEVIKPGIYPFSGPRKLFDVIAAAGGLTPKAGSKIVIVRRETPQELISITLTKDPVQSVSSNVELSPGDTVLVSKAGIVYVVGDVEKPGGFVMENNTTLTVLQAVALAEGPTRTAALNNARIIRKGTVGREEIAVPLKKILAGNMADLELKDEDILFVPSSLSKSAGKRALEAAIQTVSGIVIWRR